MTLNKLLTGAAVVQIVILGTLLIAPAQSRTQPASAQQQSNPCPAGSYNIGTKDGITPICKLEPTGCPYGDSIPMDMCDKFAPQPAEPKPSDTITPPETVKSNECGGK